MKFLNVFLKFMFHFEEGGKMKFSKWILGTALLFSAQVASIQGSQACNPCESKSSCHLCDMDFCDVQYDIYADALYWSVCKGDLNVGRTRDEDNKQKYLHPDFDWGYRIGAIAKWKNWDLGLRWTSYETETTAHYAYIPFNHAKFHFDYNVLDVEMGYNCCMECGPFTFRPLVGGKFAWIEDKFDKHSGGEARTKIHYRGYGLYIGMSGKWELCNYSSCDWDIPISLVARATGGVIHSKFRQHVDLVDIDHGGTESECIYTPYGDVYVGLDFRFCDMCGWNSFFQVGYEAQAWGWREYNHREDITYLGLGGLVLRIGTEF